ncbi:MAG TPA: DUF2141 domain-containing protein [Candidatus Saccharimonadia bacterium]|nr:DUF2141 domain-containing protein [Candidatus Saccharimonadia bacterium]
MKTFAAIAALVMVPALAHGANLEVRIEGLRETSGHLLLALTDSADAWDGKAESVARKRQPVAATSERIRFEGLEPGSYAISVFHDANDNGEMDKNIVGMPTEGYGFSQNPMVMRKATYEEARFELAAGGSEIVIDLR